jgi:hypothetical protein
VRWNHVTESGERADRLLEAVKAFAAGIGLVAAHHGGPLFGGHGAGAGIGEQVDQNVAGADLEEVIAGSFEKAFALLRRGSPQGLDAFYAEGLDDGAHTLSLAARVFSNFARWGIAQMLATALSLCPWHRDPQMGRPRRAGDPAWDRARLRHPY